jgi:hypothetical protein
MTCWLIALDFALSTCSDARDWECKHGGTSSNNNGKGEATLEKRWKGKTRKPKFPWGIALEMPRGTTMRCCHATTKRPKARGNKVETKTWMKNQCWENEDECSKWRPRSSSPYKDPNLEIRWVLLQLYFQFVPKKKKTILKSGYRPQSYSSLTQWVIKENHLIVTCRWKVDSRVRLTSRNFLRNSFTGLIKVKRSFSSQFKNHKMQSKM